MTYFLSTPIYYVNSTPHIGHAYTTCAADILVRHMAQRGEDMARIPRAGGETPEAHGHFDGPRDQVGGCHQRGRTPCRQEEQREKMRGGPARQGAAPGPGCSGDCRAAHERSACSQTSVRISGKLWIMPMSLDSS